MRIIALSDTHNEHRHVTVPDGDVLVHAGDFMTDGWDIREMSNFLDWLEYLPHRKKILIAGNHDRIVEVDPGFKAECEIKGISYIQDEETVIDGVKFWGSPYTPWFNDWAFNVPTGMLYERHWSKIPKDTDVLITHGPPYGILDQSYPTQTRQYEPATVSQYIVNPSQHVGDEELKKALETINPAVHIFGHIHGSYGHVKSADYIETYAWPVTNFYNVSICNERYKAVNEPMVIEI